MNAILFLFEHKIAFLTRWFLLITGFDTRKRDFSERLYGFYVLGGGVVWILIMLSWVVSSLSNLYLTGRTVSSIQPGVPTFLTGPFDPSAIAGTLFLMLGLWLVITPWRAQRSYDLYHFSLSDLNFLSSAPIQPRLVALFWFLKRLFTRLNGIFVLVCGIIASTLGEIAHTNSILTLVIGFFAGTVFVVVVNGFLWLLGLLRYRLVSALGPAGGYGLTSAGLALLVAAVSLHLRPLVWPSWLASSLLTDVAPSGQTALAALGLTLTAVAAVVGLYRVASTTVLVPAFEEGRLGSQLRRAAMLGGSAASDARNEMYLSRKLAAGEALPGLSNRAEGAPAWLSGGVGALLLKHWLRMSRLAPLQFVIQAVSPFALGAVVAVSMATIGQQGSAIQLVVPAIFFVNFALIRLGVVPVRAELSHIDFFAGWPISRVGLMVFNAVLGFGFSLVTGEVALLLLVASGVAGSGAVPWLALWPLLLTVAALTALMELKLLMRKWSATPESVPDVGPLSVVASSIVWLVAILWGPAQGSMAAALVVVVYGALLRLNI